MNGYKYRTRAITEGGKTMSESAILSVAYFNEAYAEHEFYSYDYLNESCRKGYFPSKRKPPAPAMKLVKD